MLSTISLISISILALASDTLALGPAPVNLRTAGKFAILGKSGVSTVPSSHVTGDVGVSPIAGTAMTGFSLTADASGTFSTSAQVSGRCMGASDVAPTPALLTAAVSDMEAAFTDAMGRPNPNFSELGAGAIGGLVLLPGLYKWTSVVTMALDITLIGTATDTWIFQISGTFNQAANTRMNLVGGALSANIIWVTAGATTIGVGATFAGNILAATNVVMQTGATDLGCIYAQTAVTLQMATISCSGIPAPPTTTAPPTPTSTRTPQCDPTPTAPCTTTAFTGLKASIQASDYLTYILVDTVKQCINACFCQADCGFVNPYHDNGGKNTTQLTCALYKKCHTASEATNPGAGGPGASITDSDGYCLC